MSDPEYQTQESLEARARLIALVSSGHVLLPYSWAHVAESSPDRSKKPETALARLELMELLANAVTFRHPAKIMTLENSDATASGDTALFGSWLHDPDETQRIAANGAQDLLAQVVVCTHEHRQVLRRICNEGEGQKLKQPLAITQSARALPMRELLSLLQLALDADIDGIAKLYHAELTQPSVFCKRATALGIQSGVAERFEFIRDGIYRFLVAGKTRWRQFTRNAEFQKTLRRLPRDFLVQKFCELVAPGVVITDHARHPGANLAAGVMHHLYSGTAGMGRNPQSSDGGDVLHAFYVPYVDVFSCDGHLATVLQQNLRPNTRIITGGPLKVVEAIESLVA
jgi:hypothetical protein